MCVGTEYEFIEVIPRTTFDRRVNNDARPEPSTFVPTVRNRNRCNYKKCSVQQRNSWPGGIFHHSTLSAFSRPVRSVSKTRAFCRAADLPRPAVCCGKGNRETCSCAGRGE